ncbi:hypothetical protein QA639_25435 [Bradyrhizobium pachyrhizi]|uniref:hypothetical protein n=1 Tax=Bradyrhizobium pachyrhizi TaxID=280333 RepID=UPI0024B16109|nr:hypothetical protein [Bradyrhizobium pachyrhizi]WFU53018.1 hypothetical protein QA639_25435 [Bradyrhizobium pachyrhizi]
MPNFEIAWSRRPARTWRSKNPGSFVVEAALTERVLLAGQPAHRLVCTLASIGEDKLDDIGERDAFWHAVRKRLGRLHRLTGRDRDEVEQQIAWRVPRPLPATATKSWHRSLSEPSAS